MSSPPPPLAPRNLITTTDCCSSQPGRPLERPNSPSCCSHSLEDEASPRLAGAGVERLERRSDNTGSGYPASDVQDKVLNEGLYGNEANAAAADSSHSAICSGNVAVSQSDSAKGFGLTNTDGNTAAGGPPTLEPNCRGSFEHCPNDQNQPSGTDARSSSRCRSVGLGSAATPQLGTEAGPLDHPTTVPQQHTRQTPSHDTSPGQSRSRRAPRQPYATRCHHLRRSLGRPLEPHRRRGSAAADDLSDEISSNELRWFRDQCLQLEMQNAVIRALLVRERAAARQWDEEVAEVRQLLRDLE